MSKEKLLVDLVEKYGPQAAAEIEAMGSKAFTKAGGLSKSAKGFLETIQDASKAQSKETDAAIRAADNAKYKQAAGSMEFTNKEGAPPPGMGKGFSFKEPYKSGDNIPAIYQKPLDKQILSSTEPAKDYVYRDAAGQKGIIDEGTEKGFTMRDPVEGPSSVVPWAKPGAMATKEADASLSPNSTALVPTGRRGPADERIIDVDATDIGAGKKGVDYDSPEFAQYKKAAEEQTERLKKAGLYDKYKRNAGVGAAGLGLAGVLTGDTRQKSPEVAKVDSALDEGLAGLIKTNSDKNTKQTSAESAKPPKGPDVPEPTTAARYKFDAPKYDDSEIQGKLSETDTKERKALDDFKSAKQTKDYLRVAETLGKALLRFGAAQQGLRDNVDLSKVGTGPGVDWASLLNEDAQLRDQELGAIGSERASLAAKRKQLIDDAVMASGLDNRAQELNTREKNDERARLSNQKAALELAQVRADLDAKENEARTTKTENKAADKAAAEERLAVNAIVSAHARGDKQALQKALVAGDKVIRPELKAIIDENAKYSWTSFDKGDSARLQNEIQSFMGGPASNEDRAIQGLEDDAQFRAILQKEIALRPGTDPKIIEAALRKKLGK